LSRDLSKQAASEKRVPKTAGLPVAFSIEVIGITIAELNFRVGVQQTKIIITLGFRKQ
jgi:hypothetical protein